MNGRMPVKRLVRQCSEIEWRRDGTDIRVHRTSFSNSAHPSNPKPGILNVRCEIRLLLFFLFSSYLRASTTTSGCNRCCVCVSGLGSVPELVPCCCWTRYAFIFLCSFRSSLLTFSSLFVFLLLPGSLFFSQPTLLPPRPSTPTFYSLPLIFP